MSMDTLGAYRLLHEGSILLSRIEANGIKVDEDYLQKAIHSVRQDMAEYEQQMRKDEVFAVWSRMFRDRVNFDSIQQLGKVIYGHFKYPCKVFTPTGQPSCTEETLSKIDIPFIKAYFSRKKLEKVLSTYLLNYQREMCDGYIHANFHILNATYRSGCKDPNLQNVPNRGGVAPKLCRTCFIPRSKDNVLVEIDYATLEVRVGCAYHKDPVMISYITDPSSDMHRDTAMKLFGIPSDWVSKKTTRDWSKNRFVFPQFYGDTYYSCADRVWRAITKDTSKLPNGKTVKEHLADQGITTLGRCDPQQRPAIGTFEHRCKLTEDDLWHNRFKGYHEWKQRYWRSYCQSGGLGFLNGFWISGVFVKNDVTNYPIQGTAFHCLLESLIVIQKHIDRYKWKTKLVNEVHDSLLADVPRTELQDFINLAKRVMTEDVVKKYPFLNVPLDIEVEVCEENWFGKVQWVEKGGKWQAKS